MKPLKMYTIPFVGLKQGKHHFEYEIDNTFFEYFEFDDFNAAQLKVNITLDKKSAHLEFHFDVSGTVNVNCDITNEPYEQPVSNTFDLVVKFGDEYNDDYVDILMVPHGTFEVNVQQYIYETAVLGVPVKRIHPGVEDGTLDSEILKKLEELSPKEQDDNNKDSEDTDPRWDKLKNLLTDK